MCLHTWRRLVFNGVIALILGSEASFATGRQPTVKSRTYTFTMILSTVSGSPSSLQFLLSRILLYSVLSNSVLGMGIMRFPALDYSLADSISSICR